MRSQFAVVLTGFQDTDRRSGRAHHVGYGQALVADEVIGIDQAPGGLVVVVLAAVVAGSSLCSLGEFPSCVRQTMPARVVYHDSALLRRPVTNIVAITVWIWHS